MNTSRGFHTPNEIEMTTFNNTNNVNQNVYEPDVKPELETNQVLIPTQALKMDEGKPFNFTYQYDSADDSSFIYKDHSISGSISKQTDEIIVTIHNLQDLRKVYESFDLKIETPHLTVDNTQQRFLHIKQTRDDEAPQLFLVTEDNKDGIEIKDTQITNELKDALSKGTSEEIRKIVLPLIRARNVKNHYNSLNSLESKITEECENDSLLETDLWKKHVGPSVPEFIKNSFDGGGQGANTLKIFIKEKSVLISDDGSGFPNTMVEQKNTLQPALDFVPYPVNKDRVAVLLNNTASDTKITIATQEENIEEQNSFKLPIINEKNNSYGYANELGGGFGGSHRGLGDIELNFIREKVDYKKFDKTDSDLDAKQGHVLIRNGVGKDGRGLKGANVLIVASQFEEHQQSFGNMHLNSMLDLDQIKKKLDDSKNTTPNSGSAPPSETSSQGNSRRGSLTLDGTQIPPAEMGIMIFQNPDGMENIKEIKNKNTYKQRLIT